MLDLRNKSTCPNLMNLVRKPSHELKELCLKALKTQMTQLIDIEGEGSKLLRSLRSEVSRVCHFDIIFVCQ